MTPTNSPLSAPGRTCPISANSSSPTVAPDRTCIELKSCRLKYYLLSYTLGVGIVQEHAANRILNDLFALCSPKMNIA